MNLGMILVRFGYNSGISIYVRPLIEYRPNGLNSNEVKTTTDTRTITGILIVALVALSAGVVAAHYGQGGGARYVDADGNGVCDNIGGCGCGGMDFVDENDDSVCDNIGINGRNYDGDYEPPRDGRGRGNGQGHGCNRYM